jgi:glucose-1-phosphate adenylyltransferase
VGKGAKIRRAIIDKWIEIPDGFEIGYDRKADAERFHVTESGIVVVPSRFVYDDVFNWTREQGPRRGGWGLTISE